MAKNIMQNNITKATLNTSIKKQNNFGLAILFIISLGLSNVAIAQANTEELVLKQNFQNVEIKVVIEAIAELTGQNFIIDPRVRGRVTLIAPSPMSPETLNETLMSILRVHNFVAIPGKTAISIVPANLARDRIPYEGEGTATAKDSWVTEVLKVNHVPATKLVAILRPIVAREGHLVALQESNTLIITDSIANIARIRSIIARVDVKVDDSFQVIKINYSSAAEIARIIKSITPRTTPEAAIKVDFDERSNNLILSGDPKIRANIANLISKLDIPIESKGLVQVIYLRHARAEDLVPILQEISINPSLLHASEETGEEASKPTISNKDLKNSITVKADERVNAIIISGPPQVAATLKEVIKQLDIRRAQVLIEAVFVEVSQEKQSQLGVEWGVNTPYGAGMINFSGTIPALLGAAITPGNVGAALSGIGRGANVFAGQISADNMGWGALIRALNSDTGSNVLATPSILTLDNEEAQIVVGREVPFVTGSFTNTAAGATNPFSTVERKNVGLKLKVTPQINAGNEVFLRIEQEVSDVLPRGDAVDLQTSKRKIKTSVIVGDGNIIVLGGLLTERETEVISRVPGLGYLPILGGLFSSRQTKREKVNLMIFLRPVIIHNHAKSSFHSRKKYNFIRAHQQQVLEHNPSMMQGLRPRLPTIEQWKNDEPAQPYISQQQQQVEEPQAEIKPTRAHQNFEDVRELLGL